MQADSHFATSVMSYLETCEIVMAQHQHCVVVKTSEGWWWEAANVANEHGEVDM